MRRLLSCIFAGFLACTLSFGAAHARCTVYYSCGELSGSAPSYQYIYDGTSVTMAQNTCTGGDFLYWTKTGSDAYYPGQSYAILNCSYYNTTWNVSAVGKVNYNVTYACGDSDGTPPADSTATTHTQFTPATNTCVTPSGKKFVGWAVSGTSDVVSSEFTWTYKGAKTLTATYTDVSTVTYSCGDVTGTPPTDSTVGVGEQFTPATNTCTTPSGKGFLGWTVSETNDVKSAGTAFTWNYAGDRTLTATYVDLNTVTYSCGDGTGTAPTQVDALPGATFTPAANTCTRDGYFFNGWAVSDTSDVVSGPFTWNYNENKTLTAQWVEITFNITTTNLSANSTFQFSISANGTFVVDCGADGVLSGSGVSGNTITRSNTTATTYTCTYSTGGVKTIAFGGTTTGYNTSTSTAAISFYQSSNNSAAKIASISGDLSKLFPWLSGNTASGAAPRFYQTFRGATNLTSISENLFSTYTTGADYMFSYTFYGCTGLTSLPAGLFSSFTTGAIYMFNYTFYGCTGLTSLPAGLFSKITTGANYMFNYTFNGCTGLTSIPAGLFSKITTSATYMFSSTFAGCTGLTSIPENLFFPNATSVDGASSMFYNTFGGCTGLTSIPAGLFSKITTSASAMFNSTFSGCTGLTSIPAGLFSSFTTGASSMFSYTFYGCTGLTSIPENLFFPNATSVTGQANMFSYTFYGCTGLTSLPAGLFSKITTSATYMFSNTFYGCRGVTSLPENLFFPNATSVNGADNMFSYTFRGCTGLTSLPAGLFSKITTSATYMFDYTFYGCTGLTSIPENLFFPNATSVNGATYMFNYTFYGCSRLTSIPAGLFSKITTGAYYMFYYTFANCTRLTSLPAGLFNSLTTGASRMFYYTFYGCTNLAGYILPTTFKTGLSADSMWDQTFYNTQLATSCPCGTREYTTGYEASWSGKVSCEPDVDADWASCQSCESGTTQVVTPGVGVTCATPPVSQITLNTTGADTGATPLAVYLKYSTGWYSDSTATNAITGLTTIPTKSGETFDGFYTGEGGTGTRVIDGNGNLLTTNAALRAADTATTVYAYFGIPYTVTYSCGDGTGGTPPADEMIISGARFTPAANTCTRDGYVFTGWAVSDTSDVVSSPFTWNYNENKTLTAQWFKSKFNITTKYLGANSTFQFSISANGTFTVYCGADGVLSGTGVSGNTITRSNTTATTYTCTYSTSGVKTIAFDGTATGYNTSTSTAAISFYNLGASKIASISGSLSELFPWLSGNTASGAAPRFYQTFRGATNLTSISENLFGTYTTGANNMFYNTFYGCTGLTSIPGNLFFSNATSVNGAQYMFYDTFYGCTGLTSIPAGLFSKITTSATYMFAYTFSGCTSLTGYIPASTFAGLVANGHPSTSYMWQNTFTSTSLLDSCPCGTRAYTTGYETSWWNGKVSCEPIVDADWASCKTCESGTTQVVTPGVGVTCATPPVSQITLNTTGADTGATPSAIYLKYNTGWYSDSTATNAITQLTTIPTKSGERFGGFYTGENATGIQIIDVNGNLLTTTVALRTADIATTLHAYFGIPYTVTYSCGDGTGGTPPADETAVSGATFIPAANTCVRDGYFFTGWTVSDTSDVVSSPFTWNYNENKTLTAQWLKINFSITTTNLNANDTFQFSMSANGTFMVDCGADGVLSGSGVSGNTITRSNTTATTYTCTYSTGGVKTIAFGGTTTGYNTSTSTAAISFYNLGASKIASISGDLSELFPWLSGNTASGAAPRFYYTFNGATNLTSISENLFSTYTTGATSMFYYTFYGCTGLTSLPEGLFSSFTTGATSMFYYTFYGCTGLTSIPENLFFPNATSVNGAGNMFQYTFRGCTGLTSIPAGLFSKITTSATYMFYGTFYGCSGLTSIPENLFFPNATSVNGQQYMFRETFYACRGLTSIPAGLFSKITTSASGMFNMTFYGCTGLTSIPGNLFFPNATSVTGQEAMFTGTFGGCTGLTSIPAGLFSKITTGGLSIFESTFNGCSRIGGYIPPTTFRKGMGSYTTMWRNTFNGTQILSYCPCGTKQYITGYEGSNSLTTWYYHVSCEPDLEADWSSCRTCESGTTQVPTPSGGITCATPPVSQITLNTTGADTGATPSAIYLKYNTGWYSDSTATNAITGLTTMPTKSGEAFAGFYTGEGGTGIQIIDVNGNLLTTNTALRAADTATTVYAKFVTAYNITYTMNGGTNYSGAPTTYLEGTGTTIDDMPTKTGSTFAGWCTDSELTTCAMTQTIGTDATGDKTFYAKWTECTACAATNASCTLSVVNNTCTYTTACNADSISIQNNGEYNASCTQCTACAATNASCTMSVVNNTCTYTTACNAGYGDIQNNGAYNASCSLCQGATYLNNGVCTACPTGYTYDTTAGKSAVSQCQIHCDGGTYVAAANDATCANVGVGYWAAASTVNYGSAGTRTACASGLSTVGYGHGADEAYDCGRILHIGDSTLYTRQNKITTPSLNFQIPNAGTFYLSLSTTNHDLSGLHLQYQGTKYTAYDDSLLNGERSFSSGSGGSGSVDWSFLESDMIDADGYYDDIEGNWFVEYPNGTVEGVALCNETFGGDAEVSTEEQHSNSEQCYYCWCKMTSPAVSNWVSFWPDSARGCGSECASRFTESSEGIQEAMIGSAH